VTFAGRFLDVFFTLVAAIGTVPVIVTAGVAATVGIGEVAEGLETPTSAGFGPCFEHALTTSNRPRIVKPAIIASFC
jgi:hypothetical protein